jgi:hypothetical protein
MGTEPLSTVLFRNIISDPESKLKTLEYCCAFQFRLCLRLIAPAQKDTANAIATAQPVYVTIKKETKTPTVRVVAANKKIDLDGQKKRQNVQVYFWNIVGSVEHINIPKLEDALQRQFPNASDRFIHSQVGLMQTEGRIKVQDNVKVWIKQPSDTKA